MTTGILTAAGYVPRRRLDRSEIRAVFGAGGGKGTRAVASYDEDTTTMGVEAARLALRAQPVAEPAAIIFATADPAYLDKTNATAIHAALRLDRSVAALDAGGAVRSGVGAALTALHSTRPTLVVAADRRTGLPTSGEESTGGDGAAALLIGTSDDGPLLAELIGSASVTHEFLDRWRSPGDLRSKQWEERFGEGAYVDAGTTAWRRALQDAGIEASAVDHTIVTGPHPRASTSLARALKVDVVDDLGATVGNTGTAHALLLLASVLETTSPSRTIAVVSLADGADVMILRTTDALGAWTAARSVGHQVEAALAVSYSRFLTWRGMVTPEPPRRPEPGRVSAPAADRNEAWKFALVDAEGHGLADAVGTITTFTIDRMAWSPSPPVVFAVIDFDDGRRLPAELTDVDAEQVAIGDRVEMTFRRLSTADGIHNYFWKARPLAGRAEEAGT